MFVKFSGILCPMKTIVLTNEVPVRHSIRPDVGREFLAIDCPRGWDDVKKLTKKVLSYEGRKFTFTGWNSDSNECYFFRPLDGSVMTARISA